MIGLVSLRWVLTAAFAGAAVFHLAGCVRSAHAGRPRGVRRRTSEVLHLLMGVSMIAMVWPWGEVVPRLLWLALFAAATAWFGARALWSPGGRLVPVFFATAMAAMVWMTVSMPAAGSQSHHHHGGVGYAGWVSGVIGGYLVLAAGWWIVRGMRLGGLSTADAAPRAPHWPAVCHGVMSVGMGLTLLAMA
jgi:hypothetical protein